MIMRNEQDSQINVCLKIDGSYCHPLQDIVPKKQKKKTLMKSSLRRLNQHQLYILQ